MYMWTPRPMNPGEAVGPLEWAITAEQRMRASGNGAQSPPPNEGNTNIPNANANTPIQQRHQNNNNSGSRSASSSNTENSGSQYAMCALGVGLVALGIVMIVWSVVPADGGGKHDGSENDGNDGGDGGGGGGGRPDNRNKVSSVAFVLVGSGVVMLLLSLCLGVRNKQRELQGLRDTEQRREAAGGVQQEAGETAEERAQRYAVPSYEEVVGSGQYPVRQSNLRQSSTYLPSYDDLEQQQQQQHQVDSVQYDNEGAGVDGSTPGDPSPAAAATGPEALAPNGRAGKTTRKLLPIKIRRIKSEKLHLKNVDNSQAMSGLSIEPLTPPPQYEDKDEQ
ncbi:hypothetical protein CRUP_014237 [Coryphaenoides rupestris]|nr:hypothetical protein CRUP_014237 [Coryphaenoides rupestris]